MPDIFGAVDSLVVKSNALFGFGWVFHEHQEIVALRFRLMFGEGVLPEYIYADIGKPREDVGSAFSNHPRALNSGYVIFGAYPSVGRLASIFIECSLADGSVIELPVSPSNVIHFSNENEGDENRLMLRQFSVFFKRGLHLVRAGKFSSLFDKVRRYLKGRPKTALQKPSDLASLLSPCECKDLCLIVDHDLGGGANHYRDRFVDSIIREGRSVIILTYHVATLSHMLIVKNGRVNQRHSIPDRTFFLDAVRHLPVSDIIYNTAVSFVRPEEIPQLLISLKQITSARLKVLVHDFYLICPSHFLLNHEGKYCHIPEMSSCANCLPKNRQGFTTLFIERDMLKWRAMWGGLLAFADEVVTFSNDTAQLLVMAYPQIEGSRVSITPHKVEHLPGKVAQIRETASLCVGVVGHIGFHKGAAFIQALAQEIKNRKFDLRIVVIGSIEISCEPSIVSQTGRYLHSELPSLIEASGANVMLFPSIWPETFSYVVQELMDMKLPVASFNFGAPAERLASYPKGLVLDSMDPAGVLDELISFHRKTYLIR